MKINKSELKKLVFSDWRYFIGFGFGSGLLPKIPGTWGTLFTIPLVYLLSFFPIYFYIIFTIGFFFLGAWLSEKLSHDLGIHDYGGVNCDEFVGFLCVMLPFKCTWGNLLFGFVLFRLFDIIKPFPINWVDENVHGGYGMMLDDILAAGMTILTMLLINHWILIKL
jgi:phosphatidylglycerophosphatase A